jgi:DNA-binding response OmpR family regulator
VPRRVLVVDDDELTLEVLKTILDLEEFEVVAAFTGEQALEVFDPDTDAVVLDVTLPGVDGFETCRRIKALREVPVVLLTGRDGDADRRRGREAGADAYLTKPFSPLALIDQLRMLAAASPRGR